MAVPITAPVLVSASARVGAGDPEVGDLHLPVGRDEHVARLHVAVDDAVAVRVRERIGDVGRDPRGLHRRESAVLHEHVAQRVAVDVLHHDERGVVVLAPVVHAHDAGMAEAGRRLRLAAEALDGGGVMGVERREHLHGDGALEQLVARDVHACHPTATHFVAELVAVREDPRLRRHQGRLPIDRSRSVAVVTP